METWYTIMISDPNVQSSYYIIFWVVENMVYMICRKYVIYELSQIWYIWVAHKGNQVLNMKSFQIWSWCCWCEAVVVFYKGNYASILSLYSRKFMTHNISIKNWVKYFIGIRTILSPKNYIFEYFLDAQIYIISGVGLKISSRLKK